MKTVLISLLLISTAAFAQVVSPEVASDPLQTRASLNPFAVPAVALARDRKGIAASWTMRDADGHDRIAVVRLDASGHFSGPVHNVPATSPGSVNAGDPSIAAAPGGDGFVLTWIERSGGAVAAWCRLDSDLNPSAPAILPTRTLSLRSPPIVRSGKTSWITADTSVWQVQTDGSLTGPLDGGITVSDMAVTTEVPQVVSGVMNPVSDSWICGCSSGRFSWFCSESCKIHHYSYSYSLHFIALYSASEVTTFPFNSDAQPAIRSDGHDALISWFNGTESIGGQVMATRLDPSTFSSFRQSADNPRILGTFGTDSGKSRPDIAADDERYVVVWRTMSPLREHDIVGASIDREGNVVSFSIAASQEDERDPSVIAIGNGTFLVAYEKFDSAGQRRIAGRLVTFERRSHAIR